MSDLLTQPITIAGLPTCPPWCPGDCVGSDDRLHEKVLAEFVAVDSDSHEDDPRQVNVRVLIERYDTLVDAHLVKEPIRTRVLVEFVHEIDGKVRVIRAALTSAELRELARAAIETADLQDAADAAGGQR